MRLSMLLLNLELARWRACGQLPVLWWRDDDARQPSSALDRLLQVAAGRPLALAIVPDGDLTALAARLAGAANVTVSQHGVDHKYRRAPGQAPSEYPPGTPTEDVAESIRAGASRLRQAGLEPVFFTPPWNQIEPALAEALVQAGFTTVSSHAPSPDVPGARRLDSHVDILRWKSVPRFRGYRRVLKALRRQLRQRREAGEFDAPICILTHHIVHDDAAWRFMAWFTRFADRRFAWRSIDALIAEPVGGLTHLKS
jgi:hypothetical protein